jgi:Ca2+-dependent lipid-binding protein
MSEKQSNNGEGFRSQETNHGAEHKNAERVDHSLEHKKQQDNLETSKSKVESSAVSKETASKAFENSKSNPSQHIPLATKHLKSEKYKHTLSSTQKHLGAVEKRFSKIAHNPAVDAVSELAEKTIARPNSLLFGSMSAFIVSTLLYLMSRHYGWSYKFSSVLVGFVGGFMLGLLIELAIRLFKKK